MTASLFNNHVSLDNIRSWVLGLIRKGDDMKKFRMSYSVLYRNVAIGKKVF